jgi:hypothetical protein
VEVREKNGCNSTVRGTAVQDEDLEVRGVFHNFYAFCAIEANELEIRELYPG